VAEEARALVPNFETVIVKRSIERMAAELLPPAKTEPMIREGTIQGLFRKEEMRPLKLEPPFAPKIELKNLRSAEACFLYPGLKRLNARRVLFECKSLLEFSNTCWPRALIGHAVLNATLEKEVPPPLPLQTLLVIR
jgi:D-amino peptidase